MNKISPDLRANIMRFAKAFAKARGIKLDTVSRLVRGDMYFLADYSARKVSITTRKYDEIMQWFEDHWPEDVPMPKLNLHT